MQIPPIPESVNLDYAVMTAKELRLAQEEVWSWIELAESAPLDDAPDDALIEIARDALGEIIAERRALHGDEPAPRGG